MSRYWSKGTKFLLCEMVKFWGVPMYRMVTIVNIVVCLKFAQGVYLMFSPQQNKKGNVK